MRGEGSKGVAKFLASIAIALEDYVPVFAKHKIDYELLFEMTDSDLKDIGIPEWGVRKKILKSTRLKQGPAGKVDCHAGIPNQYVIPRTMSPVVLMIT
jgi:hypothetical protein